MHKIYKHFTIHTKMYEKQISPFTNSKTREMQNKTTTSQRQKIPSVSKDIGKLEPLPF